MSSTTKHSELNALEVGHGDVADLGGSGGVVSGGVAVADVLPSAMEEFLQQAVAERLVSARLAHRYRRELARWVMVLGALGSTTDLDFNSEILTTQRLAAALIAVGWSSLPRQDRETTLAPLEAFCKWMVRRGRMRTDPFADLRTGVRRRSQTQRFAT